MILLQAGGPRIVVEAQEATQIRDRFQNDLAEHGGCHTLDLSGRPWRLESLHILEPVFLAVRETVINLNIEDIIASLETDVGLAVFGYLATIFSEAPALKWVNFNNNAIGTRGIDMLLPLLSNASVHTFLFGNCGLAAADAQTLRDLLTNSDTPRRMQELYFYRNQMGDSGAVFIGEILGHPNAMGLQSFSYAGCRPLREGTIDLCAGLNQLSENCGARGTNLVSLDLTDFGLGSGEEDDDPVLHICNVLRNSPRLQKLSVRDGELEVSGLRLILDALQESGAALTVLDLGVIGEQGEEGGAVLSSFLLSMGPTSRSLQELSLDTNELGDLGVTNVISGIAGACRSLQVLNLNENGIVDIVPCLLHNPIPTLRTLKLSENPDMSFGDGFRELCGMYNAVEVTVADEAVNLGAGQDEVNFEITADGRIIILGAEQGEENDGDVDALADALGGAHL
jgi:hypothetical protein